MTEITHDEAVRERKKRDMKDWDKAGVEVASSMKDLAVWVPSQAKPEKEDKRKRQI